MNRLFILGLLSCVLFTSCATLFTGTRDWITFNSNPSGAGVYINGQKVGETPCTIPVKRKLLSPDVEFRLDSYKTQIITLDQEFNLVSIINLNNLFGWAIDVASGAIMKYDRKVYDVDLELKAKLSEGKLHNIIIDSKNKTVAIRIVK